MNEKIKELAEQVDDVLIHKLNIATKQYTFLEQNLEKFAELIVQRCISLCDGNHEYKNHTDTEFGKGVAMGIYLSKNMIKEHFGVKE
jgi:hypothetical protein